MLSTPRRVLPPAPIGPVPLAQLPADRVVPDDMRFSGAGNDEMQAVARALLHRLPPGWLAPDPIGAGGYGCRGRFYFEPQAWGESWIFMSERDVPLADEGALDEELREAMEFPCVYGLRLFMDYIAWPWTDTAVYAQRERWTAGTWTPEDGPGPTVGLAVYAGIYPKRPRGDGECIETYTGPGVWRTPLGRQAAAECVVALGAFVSALRWAGARVDPVHLVEDHGDFAAFLDAEAA